MRSVGAFLGPALVAVVLGQQQDPADYAAAVRLVEQHHSREALERIAGLSAKYPGNPKVGNLKGLALLDSGAVKNAGAAFREVVRDRPDFFPALKNLAILEWVAGPRAQAIRHTAEALKLNPRDPVLNVHAAIAALERKKPEEAAQNLNTVFW